MWKVNEMEAGGRGETHVPRVASGGAVSGPRGRLPSGTLMVPPFFRAMRRPDPTRYAFGVQAPVRRGRLGLVLSALAHLLLVALLLVQLRHDFARVLDPGRVDGRRAGGGGGGGGGVSREAYISLPAPAATPRAEVAVTPPPERTPPVPVVPTPVPEPTAVVPPPPPAEPVTPAPSSAQPVPATAQSGSAGAGSGPGQGGGAGGGIGGGIGPGIGTGSGPGTGDSGSAGRGRPARPRFQAIPTVDDVPKSYRGVEIRVTFAVNTTGSVERVSFDPEISDGKFRRQLRETMLNYRFHPALGPDGAPIASTYVQTITY